MSDNADDAKGKPAARKGNAGPTPKWWERWTGILVPFGSVATILIALGTIETCRQNSLDALREDVDRDTAQIHKDVREMRKEVQGNAKNIAVLNNQVETIGKSIDKVDRKLDALLEPLGRPRAHRSPPKVIIPVNQP